MHIKRFEAATMEEALAQVRATLAAREEAGLAPDLQPGEGIS